MSKFSTGNKKADNQEEIGDAYNFHKTLKKKLNEQFWDEEEKAKDKATFNKSTATSLTDQLTKSFATQVQNDKEKSEKMRVNTQGQKNVQEELKEFDESNMLIMRRLTEVVDKRKESEAKLAEQNAA